MKTRDLLGLAIVCGTAIYLTVYFSQRDPRDAEISAKRDSISELQDTIRARAGRIFADSLRIADLQARFISDSITRATQQARILSEREAERDSVRITLRDLRASADSSELVIINRLEAAHATVIRTFELEIITLRNELADNQEIRRALNESIEELRTQVTSLTSRARLSDDLNTILERRLTTKEIELWGTRAAAVAVIVWKLSG